MNAIEKRLQSLKARARAAEELASGFQKKDAATFSACNQMLLLSQINDVLQDYDPRCLKRLLEDKPEQFLRLASALNAQATEQTRRTKLELDLQKYRDRVAEQKRKIEQALSQTHSQGLTPEVLAKIEEAARLL
jgi:hypothetical protein